MRALDAPPPVPLPASAAADPTLQVALATAMDAHDRARCADFPAAAWALLDAAGVPAATARRPAGELAVADELALVRRVGAADTSLGRLLDGHLNAVQRLRVQVDASVAAPDLAAVADGGLRLGVWGADPAGPDEGEPARLRHAADGWVLDGVKTFCSGAGGLQRAFVLARGPDDTAPLRLAYVDLTVAGTVAVDRGWYRGEGMRGSASHRVVFRAAPVLWTAPEPRALLAQPWFAQDGLRTAAGWAGGADTVVAETCAALRAKGGAGDVEALAIARLAGLQRGLGLWLEAGALALEAGAPDLADATLLSRVAIADAVRAILDEASRALGARPFATGGRVERARRDLLTYLLQHRLEPGLVGLGRRVLDGPA